MRIWAIALGCAAVLSGGILLHRLYADESRLVAFVPAERNTVLSNPYMGFAVDARYEGGPQPFRLAHANLTWRELEPEKGKYDFEEAEKKIQLNKWKQKGVKLILRVVLDYPGEDSHLDIPDWLYRETEKKGNWYDTPNGKGFSPDYSQPELIRYHRLLIEALGRRYNHDPGIAFIQLGSLGHWGEWHTWEEGKEKIPFPKRSVSEQYAEPYVKAFPDKKLLMRRPQEIALRSGMGLFNDAFGKRDATVQGFLRWYNEGYTNWLTGEEEPAMPDFWTKAPSGGEFAEESAYLEDLRIEETIRQAKLTHVTYMGPNAPVREEAGGGLQRNIDRFLNTIGYRFVITKETHEEQAQAGGLLYVELTVVNRGAAPFYYDWPLELALSDSRGRIVSSKRAETDIRTWLPGQHRASTRLPVPEDLTPGTYTVLAAVLDPDTGKPGIDFANDGKRSDGRYSLGTVKVAASR